MRFFAALVGGGAGSSDSDSDSSSSDSISSSDSSDTDTSSSSPDSISSSSSSSLSSSSLPSSSSPLSSSSLPSSSSPLSSSSSSSSSSSPSGALANLSFLSRLSPPSLESASPTFARTSRLGSTNCPWRFSRRTRSGAMGAMFLVKKESAAPLRPLRPARPTLCVYCSTLPGMSQFTTCSSPVMSKPRPATSVATSTGDLPLLKSFNAWSRLSCLSSPCSVMHFSPCRLSMSPTKFTVLILFANTSTRLLLRASFFRSSVMCFRSLRPFLCSAQTWTVWSTLRSPAAPPSAASLPPAAIAVVASLDRLPPSPLLSAASILTIAGFGASHVLATARTPLGKVALNIKVCRPGRLPMPGSATDSLPWSRSFRGSASRICSSCSANPSASMRSASSNTSILAFSRPSAPVARTASSRPGVPTTSVAMEVGCESSSSCAS